MSLPEIYVSTDIEADGWMPGQNSMLSLGSAAYFADKTLFGTFTVNLETLPDATPNPQTMAWWKTQPKAWEACRQNCESPKTAMMRYRQWLEQLPGRIIFVGQPVVFDFLFVNYYLVHFAGHNPFGYATIDIRSYAMGMRQKDYRHSGSSYLPKRWYDDLPHTHIALDDALEQGALFCNMLLENSRTNR